MDFLPMPHHISQGEGVFRLRFDTKIVLDQAKPGALLYARMLRDDLRVATGLDLAILRGKARQGDIVLSENAALAPHSYHLAVTPYGARVEGADDEALLNGVMTLRQWGLRHGAALPSVDILDAPDLAHRGYYMDCSRGRVPTLDTLKQMADQLCRYKVNQWQLYIENTYLFRDLSEAWRDETPMTAEEIMELDAYCAARHIELVPSLASFGHMYQILSTKTCQELCELRDSEKIPFSYTYSGAHHTLNVSNPESIGFIKGLIEEYGALFTSKRFNICCDETFDLGKDRSKELADAQGEHALYLRHVSELCGWLLSRGITPMFWGDMLWRHAQSYSAIPQGTICLNWGYLPEQRENEIRDLAQMGAVQYACPGVCTWNYFLPLLENSYKNIQAMCRHAHQWGAIGLLNTDWGDWGHICHPWFSLPGILYGAAFSWNAQPISYDEINNAISMLVYGDRSGGFMRGFARVCGHAVFDWQHAVQYMETEDAQRKRELINEVKTDEALAANLAMDEGLKVLDEAALSMDSSARGILQALHVAVEGVKLFNDVGIAVALREGLWRGKAPDETCLAGTLEAWYDAYKRLWRGVSKESTISRTQHIINGYADLLRGRETMA